MSIRDYLEKRCGSRLGIIRSGFPREIAYSGLLVRVESEIAVIRDDNNREWAIPLDKILLVGPENPDNTERPAGFRGGAGS